MSGTPQSGTGDRPTIWVVARTLPGVPAGDTKSISTLAPDSVRSTTWLDRSWSSQFHPMREDQAFDPGQKSGARSGQGCLVVVFGGSGRLGGHLSHALLEVPRV